MNCPNCNGNEIINGRCQYCGTFFPEYQDHVVIPIEIKGELIDVVKQVKTFRSVIV